MNRVVGVVYIAFVVLGIVLFARVNGGELVTLDLGFRTYFRVPLTAVAYGGIFVGMLIMLVAGIYSDLKVRKFLRERLREEGREERRVIDRAQQDLFTPFHEIGRSDDRKGVATVDRVVRNPRSIEPETHHPLADAEPPTLFRTDLSTERE